MDDNPMDIYPFVSILGCRMYLGYFIGYIVLLVPVAVTVGEPARVASFLFDLSCGVQLPPCSNAGTHDRPRSVNHKDHIRKHLEPVGCNPTCNILSISSYRNLG